MQQIQELQPYYPMLCESHLFSDIRREDMDQLLYCLKGRKKNFSDKEFILHAEDEHDEFGVVLEGTIQLITEDMFGNRSITAKLKEGEIFGQIAASGQAAFSPTSVVSDGPSAIMFLSFPLLVSTLYPCVRLPLKDHREHDECACETESSDEPEGIDPLSEDHAGKTACLSAYSVQRTGK